MNKGALAFIVNCMTDHEIESRYSIDSFDGLKLEYEQARRDYDKWLESITDYKAHEAAYDVVENIERTASTRAYSDGFKAGIKLMTEALS